MSTTLPGSIVGKVQFFNGIFDISCRLFFPRFPNDSFEVFTHQLVFDHHDVVFFFLPSSKSIFWKQRAFLEGNLPFKSCLTTAATQLATLQAESELAREEARRALSACAARAYLMGTAKGEQYRDESKSYFNGARSLLSLFFYNYVFCIFLKGCKASEAKASRRRNGEAQKILMKIAGQLVGFFKGKFFSSVLFSSKTDVT